MDNIVEKFSFMQKYFGEEYLAYDRIYTSHNNYIYELIRKDLKGKDELSKTIEKYHSLQNLVGNKKWYEIPRNMDLALSFPCTGETFYFLIHGFISGSIEQDVVEELLDKMIEQIAEHQVGYNLEGRLVAYDYGSDI